MVDDLDYLTTPTEVNARQLQKRFLMNPSNTNKYVPTREEYEKNRKTIIDNSVDEELYDTYPKFRSNFKYKIGGKVIG